MRSQARSFACVAGSIVLCTLLVACGHTDPDTRTLPALGGSAGAVGASGAGGGSGVSGGSDPSDQTGPADTSTSGNTRDSGSGDEDDDGSRALREVPGGTLTWTVVYKGNGTTRTTEFKEVATLQRRMEGKAHMVGIAGDPGKKIATPLDDINKTMQACGDDMACQQAAAMQAMAKMQQNPDAIKSGMQKAQDESQRDTTWGADSCSARAKADDTATWSGMTPLGFNTGVGTRIGGQAISNCTVQLEEGDVRPRLVADGTSKTYELALPSAEIRVTGTIAGKTESVPRIVQFPPLLIRGVKYTTLAGPLSGSATVKSGTDRGVWSEGWTIPLTEEVSWTFTPDAK